MAQKSSKKSEDSSISAKSASTLKTLNKHHILQIITIILLVVALALIVWAWRSSGDSGDTRTITVNGTATIEAEPDEYRFSPTYEESGYSETEVRNSLKSQTDKLVKKLNELGVEDSDIRLDASSYTPWYQEDGAAAQMQVAVDITVDNQDLAQKISDYLSESGASGRITPAGVFSDEKLRELDEQATKAASEDARSKAQSQAEQFDAKLGEVIEISSAGGGGSNGSWPESYSLDDSEENNAAEGFPVLSGKSEYTKTIKAIYSLK